MHYHRTQLVAGDIILVIQGHHRGLYVKRREPDKMILPVGDLEFQSMYSKNKAVTLQDRHRSHADDTFDVSPRIERVHARNAMAGMPLPFHVGSFPYLRASSGKTEESPAGRGDKNDSITLCPLPLSPQPGKVLSATKLATMSLSFSTNPRLM